MGMIHSPSRQQALALRSAILVFISTLFLTVLVQGQNAWRFGSTPGTSWIQKALFQCQLIIFAQGQTVLIAAALAGMTYFGWQRRLIRIASIVTTVLINLITVLDQISYRLYFQHFQLEMGDGGVPPADLLISSFHSEVDWVLVLDLSIFLVFPISIFFLLKKLYLVNISKGKVRWIGATLTLWCLLGLFYQFSYNKGPLPIHPFVAFVQSAVFPSRIQSTIENSLCSASKSQTELYSNWHGSSKALSKEAQYSISQIKSLAKKKLNVLLVVLESAGAFNVLSQNGYIDPAVMPNLEKVSRESYVFTKLYDLFPGTMRSHVPLQTGGSTITSGSAYHEYSTPYRGATLISQFRESGYSTALFSAQYMRFENIGKFYSLLPFDFRVTPETELAAGRETPQLNSWGVEDDFVRQKLSEWLAKRKGSLAEKRVPFFAEFMTLATHHPYSIPKGFSNMTEAENPLARYRQALRYTDWVLGNLVQSLKDSGEWDNTILAVMGDHGESFGDRHFGNSLHGNFLYEEDIRNFLLVRAPGLSPARDERVVYIGDVAPTLISFARGGKSDANFKMLGHNLFDPSYSERIRFFHKNITPERWGLVDGNWKYIGARLSLDHPELYDLSIDPLERNNLAEAYPDRVAEYECRVRQWYMETQREYLTHLDGFGQLAQTENDFELTKKGGPRVLVVGIKKDNELLPVQGRIPANAKPVLQIDWAPQNETKHFELKWIAPNHEEHSQKFSMPWDVNREEIDFPSYVARTPGKWRIELRTELNGPANLQKEFLIE